MEVVTQEGQDILEEPLAADNPEEGGERDLCQEMDLFEIVMMVVLLVIIKQKLTKSNAD